MTIKSPRISMPARERSVRRQVRGPFTAPAVTRDEVSLSVQILAAMYSPLESHAEELESWGAKSRQSAHALVQFGWTMAKVEAEIGDRKWFRTSWIPQMKEAKESGEALPAETPEGSPVRMGRKERDLLISAVGPMFCAKDEATDALSKLIPVAVVGKRGSHIRASMKLVELVLGEEAYGQFEEALKAARAEDAATPAPDAEVESDEDETPAEEEAPAAEAASA